MLLRMMKCYKEQLLILSVFYDLFDCSLKFWKIIVVQYLANSKSGGSTVNSQN